MRHRARGRGRVGFFDSRPQKTEERELKLEAKAGSDAEDNDSDSQPLIRASARVEQKTELCFAARNFPNTANTPRSQLGQSENLRSLSPDGSTPIVKEANFDLEQSPRAPCYERLGQSGTFREPFVEELKPPFSIDDNDEQTEPLLPKPYTFNYQ